MESIASSVRTSNFQTRWRVNLQGTIDAYTLYVASVSSCKLRCFVMFLYVLAVAYL